MEATKESEPSRILDAILPRHLEDDCLEDPALPPESFKDAFARAAATVKSRAASIFTPSHGEDCVNDPWPIGDGLTDVITGEPGGHEPEQPCTTEKGSGGGIGEVGEDVVVPGVSGEGDKVVVGKGAEEDDRGACVDGLQGLDTGERGENGGGGSGDGDGEGGGDEVPTLVEGVA
ncbi:uncharacterized protein LOC104424168 [Eucalyptus grandis]|uniref:uncharacterized protein LOC104424168 n=1 Tax=Eucalyptus grandis TaxID=71139 RepID=UPI00192EAA50|nr:uncharacterized protein LOC104424168 [Eucalyptus grandis]